MILFGLGNNWDVSFPEDRNTSCDTSFRNGGGLMVSKTSRSVGLLWILPCWSYLHFCLNENSFYCHFMLLSNGCEAKTHMLPYSIKHFRSIASCKVAATILLSVALWHGWAFFFLYNQKGLWNINTAVGGGRWKRLPSAYPHTLTHTQKAYITDISQLYVSKLTWLLTFMYRVGGSKAWRGLWSSNDVEYENKLLDVEGKMGGFLLGVHRWCKKRLLIHL